MDKQEPQLKALFEAEDQEALIGFFIVLSSGERRKLAPLVKAQMKAWQVNDWWWHNRFGSDQRMLVLHTAGLFCFSLSEYEKARFALFQKMHPLLKCWAPDWLDRYMINFRAIYAISYDWLMQLEMAGTYYASGETVVKFLPQYLFKHHQEGRNNKRSFDPQKLLRYPQTTQRHIGHLFQFPSEIHRVESYDVHDIDPQPAKWKYSIAYLITEGHLDRLEILKESLRATLRQFIKPLTNWFIDLFVYLQPNQEELQALQAELIQCLVCPQAKVVRIAINQLKKLVKEPDFQTQDVVAAVAPHLQSETKAVVKAALGLYQRLAPTAPKLQLQMSEHLAMLFLLQDAKLQAQGADFLVKYADPSHPALQGQLALLQDSMLSATKETLQPFLHEKSVATIEEEIDWGEVVTPLDPSRAFSMPSNVDDLVYLCLQALESDDLTAQLLVPGALQLWFHDLKGADLDKFGPVVQKACKLIQKGDIPFGNMFQYYLVYFILAVIEKLIERSPQEGAGLRKIIRKREKQQREYLPNFLSHRHEIWAQSKRAPLAIWMGLLRSIIKEIDQRSGPLLSSPTHAPFWLSPRVLMDRLAHQEADEQNINGLDLIFALFRIPPDHWGQLVEMAQARVSQGVQTFIKQYGPASDVAEISWDVGSYEKHYQFRGERHSYTVMEVIFDGHQPNEEITRLAGSIDYLIKARNKRAKSTPIIGSGDKLKLFGEETSFFISLYPREFDAVYEYITKEKVNRLRNDIGPAPMFHRGLEALIDYPYPLGQPPQVFLAAAFLYAEKSIRQFAAEIWNQKVAQKLIAPKSIGRAIGRLEVYEYGPLKRLTDLLEQNMLRISRIHNLALVEMLEACFAELPDQPIRNLKRLLEIYYELLVTTERSPQESQLRPKLQSWQKANSTKSIAKKILAI